MCKTKPYRSAVLAIAVLIAGCATAGGRIGPLPTVNRPAEAGTLSLFRDGSLVGWFAPMRVRIDQNDLYRLGRNQRFSLNLDPGDYLLEYSIGFNTCSRSIHLKPRQTLRLRLVANCMIYEE
ncbi:hypothetical protein CCR95_09840 [Thiocystis minor]|uniref:hypothetical protein n=1 Tax=Thiocystis minor TaxID=61597 RepID=UPI00191245A2|nr:hypothetical protein [Thiocystis minor]MBK5964376.1 hypothetical protein [Thiocystis minor]